MSSKRLHAEWLSLIEVSGPFLTMPVLEKVFPQGLDAHDAEGYRNLRLAFEEWEEQPENPALHRAWIRYVLQQTLGLPDEVLAEGQAIPEAVKATAAEHGETLRPDLLARNPADGEPAHRPRLLIQVYPAGQELEKPVEGRRWKASPATRMVELLHATETNLGLITNGERWMLVHAPRNETTGFASWYAGLWTEEKLTLQAFVSLLGVRRFFGVPESETLEAMLAESAKHQQEVTDQLGYQVRRAVEVLVHSLDRADQEADRTLLRKIPDSEVYESALTVMMRLVFLFCAEERGLLLLGDEMYDRHYAVSTLVAQLQAAADQHGEEVLERRLDAWVRLLSTFRAVFGGIEHDRMKLPAYGGRLFDPDRFPFLEGRAAGAKWRETPANPLPIDNRTVLHLLRSLQYLEMQGEARRLSFRALDIEQIGHVYEGLLDHTAKCAPEPILGLIGPRGDEPEIVLSELEQARNKGNDDLIAFLREQTGKSENALRRLLETELETDQINRVRAACNNDDALFKRVRPFAAFIRDDSFDRPVVIAKGSVYVTAGTDRRSTATHYTQRSLTEPIVKHALDPLIYIGPAEGLPEWKLRSARELLELKICDPACGSGAFLVQACRYLSERLIEAWDALGAQAPSPADLAGSPSSSKEPLPPGTQVGAPAHPVGITPFGEPATGAPNEALIPADPDERMAYARRIVAQRCLYGVDKNPLAVEMAKLSLWLLTLAKDKPFEFLDHAIRHGDSLIGIHRLDQIRYFTLDREHSGDYFISKALEETVAVVLHLRRLIEAHPADMAQEAEAQRRLLDEADAKSMRLRLAADLLIAVEFNAANARQKEDLRNDAATQAAQYLAHESIEAFQTAAKKALGGRPTFHWPLEFPEVFGNAPPFGVPPSGGQFDISQNPPEGGTPNGGFDAIVCNPPFIGGKKVTGILGTQYRNFLIERLANGAKGNADLSAYFFLQAKQLLRQGGYFGILATNTIAQGDTREVGLDQITDSGGFIYRGISSRPWPGAANLEVAEVWLRNGTKWHGECFLDDAQVPGITPFLTKPGRAKGKPYRLAANADKSFQGSIVLGMGFVLTPEEAHDLIEEDERNRDVLFPYLNGEDLNSRPDQSPSRWAINFHDWPLERSAKGSWFKGDKEQIRLWLQSGLVPKDYPDPVATDYLDCLKIVEEKVKPERKEKAIDVAAAPWWRYWRIRGELYAAIARMELILVIPETTKYCSFSLVKPNVVFSHMTKVIAIDGFGNFCHLNSTIHEVWARQYSSTLESRLKYITSDAFETFPFAKSTKGLDKIGQRYDIHRQSIMLACKEGLTKTYNRFHDPEESSDDIRRLRELHQEMDEAVAHAYGWTDLRLDHDFHETKQGIRFTISEAARREVLDRLLELNHKRYAEEVAAGLHEKGAKKGGAARKGGRGKRAAGGTPSLFGEEEA